MSDDGTAFCWIEGTCGPVSAIASGGQLTYPPDGSNSTDVGSVAVGTSFLLPVPANNPFTLSVNNSSANAVNPVVSLVWIPMGTGQITSS
ncbi:MAG TPA: hypothetical protein VFT45_16725 [Longimicrobium sp.]|nr:hypothetical protein [Longimicrobium sp.]